jgi:hypothetical protein
LQLVHWIVRLSGNDLVQDPAGCAVNAITYLHGQVEFGLNTSDLHCQCPLLPLFCWCSIRSPSGSLAT